VEYMHPEIGVKATDGAVFGRNYFNRSSVPKTEDDEFADERAEILAEMKTLRKHVVDYMHPEIGVKTTDGAAFGRNYFNRHSVSETEEDSVTEEREQILAEMKSLKKLAVDYMHPEIGVKTTDGAVFGRNYFSRHSSPETEDDVSAEAFAELMTETKMLKKLAVDYMHPENGVKDTDGLVFGRNYFSRPSALETEANELANERAKIRAEMMSLKKLSVDFAHPENGVKVSDGSVSGRNYFNRPTAPETEENDFAHERAEILSEKSALMKYAVDYMHPEVGVMASDGTTFGRNYFGPDKNAVYSESTTPFEAAPTNTNTVNETNSCGSSNMFELEEGFAEMRATFSTFIPSNQTETDSSGSSHMFELDEDFAEMRTTFATFIPSNSSVEAGEKQYTPNKTSIDDEEEGKLSRSPSSVMLFALGQGNNDVY